MADNYDVKVRGFAELASGTRKLAGNIEEAAPRKFEQVASDVAGQVSSVLPKLTGRLAGSVVSLPQSGGAIVGMGGGVDYAGFVEFGGRGHPHSGTGNYLYPAAMGAESALQAAGVEVANSEIGSMSWPSPA